MKDAGVWGMVKRHAPGVVVLAAVLVAVLASCTGCPWFRGSGVDRARGSSSGEPAAGSAKLPVVIYLVREGRLEPVVRKVAVPEGRRPAAALQLLVAGPTPTERERGFVPVLPPATRVLGVTIENGVTTADFSREVITRSSDVACGSSAEVLALNAVYFTLVQFPGVERVKLLVKGKSRGSVDGRLIKDFWGHVGLPEHLSGDLELVDLPDRQDVGGTESAAGWFRLKAVRWAGYPGVFRLVFELEAAGGTSAPAGPAVVAYYSRSSRVLHVILQRTEAVGVEGVKEGAVTRIGDWRAVSLARERAEPRVAAFGLALEPGRNYGWRASVLSDPCRVVVDVFSCSR
jgi:hypothetical protein